MFDGLALMVDGKMCVYVSGENLMYRFDPLRTMELSQKQGYLPMTMNGRNYKGYCYVEASAILSDPELFFWIDLCLDFDKVARSSKMDK